MDERQKKFISAVVSRQTPENKPVLEAVLKAYVMNEGILDKVKTAGHAVAGKVLDGAGKAIDMAGKAVNSAKKAVDPTPESVPQKKEIPDYAALRRAAMFEKDCWDRDFVRFEQNCEMVKYYLSTYGIRDFNAIICSPDFKKAVVFGKQLDNMRMNPLIVAEKRRQTMHECLDLLNTGDNRVLIEGILMDFDETETVSVDLPPVFESREDNLGSFKEAMAGIANFIRRHGVYPWNKFLSENRMLLSRAHRFDKVEYPKEKERPDSLMAADILSAYSAGSSDTDTGEKPVLHEAADTVQNKREYRVGDMLVSMYPSLHKAGIRYVQVEVPRNGIARNEWSAPIPPDLSADSIRKAVRYVYRRIVAMAMWNAANDQDLLPSDRMSLAKYAADEDTLMSSLDFDQMSADARAMT